MPDIDGRVHRPAVNEELSVLLSHIRLPATLNVIICSSRSSVVLSL